MNLLDSAKSLLGISKAQVTQESYSTRGRLGSASGVTSWTFREPRRGSKLLRQFADNNEFVRTAINRRKRQVGMAGWQLVRRDDPNGKPDARVMSAVKDLFDMVNPKGESLRALFDQVIEDTLTLDAGCIEKEKSLGGQILALHAVDGATIAPDPDWDGTNPKAIRYRQYIEGRVVAELRNDQLTYIMANPSTHRAVGWSPLETLFRVVRAELYGEEYDYDMMRQTAPNVFLYLGNGITDEQRDSFIEYWESEVAGQKATAVMSNADPDGKAEPKVYDLRKDTFEERLAYKKWLATKIAAVFEMDLLIFNLSEAVQKSVGNSLTARTDEGANGLASLIAEYVTREIVWEIDPNRDHAFKFDDLNQRDELAQAKIDDIYVRNGVTYPNEVRAGQGKPPVTWGEEPQLSAKPGGSDGNGNGTNDSSDNPDASAEAGKSAVPFVAASRTRTAALSYLDG